MSNIKTNGYIWAIQGQCFDYVETTTWLTLGLLPYFCGSTYVNKESITDLLSILTESSGTSTSSVSTAVFLNQN